MTTLKTTELLDHYIKSASEKISQDVKMEKSQEYLISVRQLEIKAGKQHSRKLFTTAHFKFKENLTEPEPTLVFLDDVFKARRVYFNYYLSLLIFAIWCAALLIRMFADRSFPDYLMFLYLLVASLSLCNVVIYAKKKNKFKDVKRDKVELIKVNSMEYVLFAKLEKLISEKESYRTSVELFFESFYESKTTSSKEALKASISIAKKLKEKFELSKELREISEEEKDIVTEEKWKFFNDNGLHELT